MSNSTSPILSSRSVVAPVEPNLVPFVVRKITVTQNFRVAIAAVLVYDACESLVSCLQPYSSHRKVITLDKEVSRSSPCVEAGLSASDMFTRSNISG